MNQFAREHPELAAQGIDYRDHYADLADMDDRPRRLSPDVPCSDCGQLITGSRLHKTTGTYHFPSCPALGVC